MQHVWDKVKELRRQYPILRDDKIPIDVFLFFEINLELNAIPFDDLSSKYRREAAISSDFTSIYLDAEQYILMEKGPDWKLARLRFTIAHELGHFFLHQSVVRNENLNSVSDFSMWVAKWWRKH